MVTEKLLPTINKVIAYWQEQNIKIFPKSNLEVDDILFRDKIDLPDDFKQFYLKVNGMQDLYPNEGDQEGFLFYPIEVISSESKEFEVALLSKKNIYIFADYMQKSWWYGVEVFDKKNYTIGIIPEKNKFKPITNFLDDFLTMYLIDSPMLYDR